MSPARIIREEMSSPGASTYFGVAVAAGLLVLALTGLVARSQSSPNFLLPASALHTTTNAIGGPTVAYASNVAGPRGDVQVVRIDGTHGDFRPNQIRVKANQPIKLEFTAGRGCSTSVEFDTPSISADLSERGAALIFSGLHRGVYPFKCAHGVPSGMLLVE